MISRRGASMWISSGVLARSRFALLALGILLASPSTSDASTFPSTPENQDGVRFLEDRATAPANADMGGGDASMDSELGGEMIFVTTAGRVNNRRGCSALSVVSLHDAAPAHLGAMSQSYSRIDASSDFSRVMTAPQDGGRFRFHALEFDQAPSPNWKDRFIRSNEEELVALNRQAVNLSDDGNILYTTAYSKELNRVGVGEFDITALELDPFQNPRLGKIRRFHDTEPYFYTRSARGTRVGEVNYLGISRATADAVIQTLDLTTGDFVGDTIPVKSMVAVDGKDMKTAYLTASRDGRYLVTNLWYSGEINLVDLEERTSRVVPLRGMTMTGGVAINRGWVNPGLLAVHAGTHVQVLRLSPSTAEVEQLASMPVDGPSYWLPPNHQVPAQIAWSTSGDQLIVSVDHDDSEFVVIDVLDEGRQLRTARYITVCNDDGQYNNGFDILTCNGVFDAPPGPDHNTRCFAPPLTPAATQTIPEPTATVRMTESPSPVPTQPSVLMPLLMKGP